MVDRERERTYVLDWISGERHRSINSTVTVQLFISCCWLVSDFTPLLFFWFVALFCHCLTWFGLIQRILQIDSNCCLNRFLFIHAHSCSRITIVCGCVVICLVILPRINENDLTKEWTRDQSEDQKKKTNTEHGHNHNCRFDSFHLVFAGIFTELASPMLNLIYNFIVVVWFQFNALAHWLRLPNREPDLFKRNSTSANVLVGRVMFALAFLRKRFSSGKYAYMP